MGSHLHSFFIIALGLAIAAAEGSSCNHLALCCEKNCDRMLGRSCSDCCSHKHHGCQTHAGGQVLCYCEGIPVGNSSARMMHHNEEEGTSGDGTIYIIRHGEKNHVGDLSSIGKARAKYISTIFPGKEYKKPQALFAGHYTKGEPQRTLHTIQPTADHLHLKVDTSFTNEDHSGAAKAFLSELKRKQVVMAAWEHCNIKKTCYALAGSKMCDAAFHHSSSSCGWWTDDYDSVAIFTVKHGKVTSVEHKHEDFKKIESASIVV